MAHLVFLDTEVTKLDQPRLVQLSYHASGAKKALTEIFKPAEPISFRAMAEHGITRQQADQYLPFDGSASQAALRDLAATHIFVAHNAAFDAEVLRNEGVEPKFLLCTMKVAAILAPDVESYNLMSLIYELGLNDENLGHNPHNADFDRCALERLYEHLWGLAAVKWPEKTEKERLYEMVLISARPMLLRTCYFKKHTNTPWAQVATEDRSYLEWVAGNAEFDEDMRYTARFWLDNKSEAATSAPQPEAEPKAAPTIGTDLPF